ncbi:MAG: HlyD family type I secretion periplasmic adaptor subunit [Thermodesulfobacteriota bacterium]
MNEKKIENGLIKSGSGAETARELVPVDRLPEEQSWMDEAAVVEEVVGRAPRYFLMLLVGTCLLFFIWAAFGKLDIFSMAQGEVVPSTKVKSVQHLEGGIVQRILVREGERVKKDEPLVELQTTASDADVRELNLRIKSLEIEGIRLSTEFAGRSELTFNSELAKDYPELVKQAKDLFRARRERLRLEQERQKQLVNQSRQQMDEIEARLRNQKEKLTLLQEQISISEELLKDDLTNRYTHLELLKEENTLKSAIEENEAAYNQAETALKMEEVRLNGILSAYNEEVQTALDENRGQYDGYLERLKKFDDNLQRTVLRAPVDGIIKTLYLVTEGGVIRPGETVLDIVPEGDLLIVEARLPTQDIGYIHAGQKAVIKLTTADARRFGNINGEVVHISPDTLVTDKGQPYYSARVATEESCFKSSGGDAYCLYPGMTVLVNIHTGQRTVLEYLLSPFFASMDSALTER